MKNGLFVRRKIKGVFICVWGVNLVVAIIATFYLYKALSLLGNGMKNHILDLTVKRKFSDINNR